MCKTNLYVQTLCAVGSPVGVCVCNSVSVWVHAMSRMGRVGEREDGDKFLFLIHPGNECGHSSTSMSLENCCHGRCGNDSSSQLIRTYEQMIIWQHNNMEVITSFQSDVLNGWDVQH